MFIQVVTKKGGKPTVILQDVADTSRIRELLRINPFDFIGSSVTNNPENIVKELQKLFKVMHVEDRYCVELASY